MFNAKYFRDVLGRDVKASGGAPIVELQLVSGHAHRLRSVIDAGDEWVTVEAYLVKGDLAHHRPRFGGTEGEPHEVFRVVIAYDAIAALVFDPSPAPARTRTGFSA